MKSTAQGHSQTTKPDSSEKFLGQGRGRPSQDFSSGFHEEITGVSCGCWTVPPGGIIFSALKFGCLVADTFIYN